MRSPSLTEAPISYGSKRSRPSMSKTTGACERVARRSSATHWRENIAGKMGEAHGGKRGRDKMAGDNSGRRGEMGGRVRRKLDERNGREEQSEDVRKRSAE
eukprot:6189709-Pleurochrysis_carterae.AAC.1